MINISKGQIDIFSREKVSFFCQSLLVLARTEHPGKSSMYEDEEIISAIKLMIDDMYIFGIKTESGCTKMFELCLLFGFGFYNNKKYKWAIEILETITLNEEDKLNKLML